MLNKPTLVTSWTQFVSIFGDFTPGAYLPDAVYGYFANGGGPCFVSLRALKEGGQAPASASATVLPGPRPQLLQVVAKAGGPTSLAVTVKAGEGETFSVSVGGETKADLTMKKGEPNYVGDAEFSAVDITEVAQQPPSLPTASTR